MEAGLLAIPLQNVLGTAAPQGHRAGPCHSRISTRRTIPGFRAFGEFGSRSDGTSENAAGEDRVPDVTVNGAIIHYETEGEGFPLVLLHGIGSNSRSWRRQLNDLSSSWKVVAWDAPGYGRSSDPVGEPSMRFYADRLRSLLDALGLKRIFLLGHSTGGVIAQEFYRENAECVAALILSDTRYLGSQSTLEERLNSIRTMTPAALAAARAPRLLSPNAPEALVREVASIMSEVHPSGYEFAAIALARSDT